MGKAKPQAIAQTLTERLGGSWCEPEGKPPFGELLRCPLCGKYRMKVALGDRGDPVVFCLCSRSREKQSLLLKAVTKATGIWLAPKPRREKPQKLVERMRRSPEYESLPSRAKKLVDHLVEAYFGGEPNGGIVRTGTELMAALGLRSRAPLYRAINAAIDAKIVFRGSRALSRGYGHGPMNLWGVHGLPKEPPKRSEKGRDEAETTCETTWTEPRQRGGQPIDPARGGCAVVRQSVPQSASAPPTGAGRLAEGGAGGHRAGRGAVFPGGRDRRRRPAQSRPAERPAERQVKTPSCGDK